MAERRKARDNKLLDALETSPPIEFEDRVWRVVRGDRDPLRGSSPGGRWDDGTFDVLYTSTEADGALAEIHFHIMRGQPIFPSEMEFLLYELDVTIMKVLRLGDKSELEALDLDMSSYGTLEHARKTEEYVRMQAIGEAAYFLDFGGLLVPSARRDCLNLVIFCDRVPPDNISIAVNHGPVDWNAWQRESKET